MSKTDEVEKTHSESGFHIMTESGVSATRAYYRVLITCVTIQTGILMAGIPWASSIHGRVTAVETHLSSLVPLSSDIKGITAKTNTSYIQLLRENFALTERIIKCEAAIDNIHKHVPPP